VRFCRGGTGLVVGELAVGEHDHGVRDGEEENRRYDQTAKGCGFIVVWCGGHVFGARVKDGGSGNNNGGHLIVLLDLGDDIQAFCNLSKDRVHAIEVPAIVTAQHHEELRSAGVLARVRHRE